MIGGNFQIPIKEDDNYVTIFITIRGLWEFTAMPFDLIWATANFHRVMGLTCRGLEWQIV